MVDENPYRAPVSPDPGQHGVLRQLLNAGCFGLAIGVMLGTIDIHIADGGYAVEWAYFFSGLALGSIYVWRASAAWPPMAVSLFVVHLIALSLGYRQPFVERDAASALICLPIAALTSAAGLVVGAVVRCVVSFGARVLKGAPETNRGGAADDSNDIDIIIYN